MNGPVRETRRRREKEMIVKRAGPVTDVFRPKVFEVMVKEVRVREVG